MSKYYYLIAGLPDLALEESKLSYTVGDFKTLLYADLSEKDKKLIDLFYLRFDNKNLLSLLKDREGSIDDRGKYTADELVGFMELVKEGDELPDTLFPAYLSRFLSEYFTEQLPPEILPEDRLSALYYAYAMECGNPFVAAWFELNLNLNNLLVALTARKYKLDTASLVVGDNETAEALRSSNARDFGLSGELDYLEQVIKIHEIPELVEREKQLDLLRWEWLENESFFNYFTIEKLFAFLVRLEMIERWISLDKAEGDRLFRGMIETLKNEVQIPSEFR